MRTLGRFGKISGLCLTVVAAPAFAIEDGIAAIDRDLAGQVDFRDLAFEACLNEEACTVDGLTVIAERLSASNAWVPAQIYWDPVDGFGVMGGNQNDEIDVDERLTIQLDGKRGLVGAWLSDLFVGEGSRYLGWPESEEDVELADLSLFTGANLVGQYRVSGTFQLPPDPFNAEVDETFTEQGDMLNRVLVDNAQVSVLMPEGSEAKGAVVAVGALDAEKITKAAFDDQEILRLRDLLGDDEKLATFADGTANADGILSIRKELSRLAKIRLQAEELRLVGDVSNGELGWFPQQTQVTDRIVLTAGFSTSSDFSIAGLMFEETSQ